MKVICSHISIGRRLGSGGVSVTGRLTAELAEV